MKEIGKTHERAQKAFLNVLPPQVREDVSRGNELIIGDLSVHVSWVSHGNLPDIRELLSSGEVPDVVASPEFSPGARAALSEAGVSWVDETGAAAVALGTIIVARDGRPKTSSAPSHWTQATVSVAESLLCGQKATVSATKGATGLSSGSCANALRFLTDQGLLEADAERGRHSGRHVRDAEALLAAYTRAAKELQPSDALQVGVMWRDPVEGLATLGEQWREVGVGWCATGALAAAVLAPYLTNFGSMEAYIDTATLPGLEAAARDVGLRPLTGGRLTLRPMPTNGVRRLTTVAKGLKVAPWPRIYVDLCATGVRGEEAAEHLREVLSG